MSSNNIKLKAEANNYPSWQLTNRQICDLELILNGGFHPINGFLSKNDYDSVVNEMAEETGAIAARIMPTIRFFKIGVNFDMIKQEGAAYEYFSPDGYGRTGSAVEKKPE